MRNEQINPERLPPPLDALADSLAHMPLAAQIPNRDRLLYLCGQAAAKRPSFRDRVLPRLGVAAAIAMVAYGLGGLTVHWASAPSTGAPPLAAETRPEQPAASPLVPSAEGQRKTAFPADTIAAIQSGRNLFAAMDPARLPTVPTTMPATGALSHEAASLRAGMVNQWLKQTSNW